MTAEGSGSQRRFGGRFARLLCLVATFLLFVAPAHATMQAIACEHLPQSFSQIFDEAKTSKLILRADNGPCAAAFAAQFEPDQDHFLIAPAAARLAAPAAVPLFWTATAAPHRAERLTPSAPQRAPPAI